MNIACVLEEQARLRPGAAALIDHARGRDRIWTFGELARAGAAAAARLRAAGLRPGDTVLLLHPMSAELYVALSGVFRAGLTAMFLEPALGRDDVARCCGLRPPRAFIGSSKALWLGLFSPALRRIPTRFSMRALASGAAACAAEASAGAEVEPRAPDSPALLTFTSGSTGRPKAVARTHAFLRAQHRAIAETLGLAAERVELTTLPIFVLANLASGAASLLADADLRRPGAVDPEPVLGQIDRLRPDRCAASPAFLERLIEGCRRENLRLESLEKIHVGGGPVFPKLMAELRRIAPRAEVSAVYGSTEAEPIARIGHGEFGAADLEAMLAGRGLLAGKPVAGIRVKILRDSWGTPLRRASAEALERLAAPAGRPGEIVVAGDHVLPGYLDGAGDEETKLHVDGEVWHRTGDAGYLDASGRLWLLGRCEAKIRDRRGVVFPLSVECAAQNFPFVRRAAFDASSGRRVLAVETRDGRRLLPEEARELRGRLSWAGIDEVRAVEAVPMDLRHNAKVDYPALRELLA